MNKEHMTSKVWDEITYQCRNFNDATVEVLEWMSSFMPNFVMDAITYPCWDSRISEIMAWAHDYIS